MAASVIPKIMRDGTITILGGAAETYTVSYEDGDFAFSKDKDARIVVRDRGTIVGVRKGDSPVISGSFTVHMRDLTDGVALSLTDVLDKSGFAASWTSTGSGAFEDYMVNFVLTIDGGDVANNTVTLDKCIATWDFSEGQPNKVSVKFECFGGLTFVGAV